MHVPHWTLRLHLLCALSSLVFLWSCKPAQLEEANASPHAGLSPAKHDTVQVIERSIPTTPSIKLTLDEALTWSEPFTVNRDAVRFRPKGSPCAGTYADAPTIRLKLTEEATLKILATAHNTTDMVLALQRSDGEWVCNDDWGDTSDPGVIVDLSAGEHLIYFGAWGRLRPLDYSVSFERVHRHPWERCEGTEVIEVQSGDDHVRELLLSPPLEPCQSLLEAPNCGWMLPSTPSACIDLVEDSLLQVSTENASYDTVLALQSITGTGEEAARGNARLFNDDISSTDTHSQVEAITKAGRYAIFVGTYRPRDEGSFHLRITAQTPVVP